MNTIIHTPTPNLQLSLEFYKRLNFCRLPGDEPVIVSDGKVIIEINPNRFARAGVKMYKSSWDSAIVKLQKLTHVTSIDSGHLLADPSGSWIYLLEGEGPDLDISKCGPPVIGNYSGLSLESVDIQKSLEIYQILGFNITMGAIEHGWIALANDEGAGMSLMKPNACPHLFFNPSLTFFNSGKNPEVIAKVRELEVPITEEITHFSKDGSVDNIIIRDPGGVGFFIFND